MVGVVERAYYEFPVIASRWSDAARFEHLASTSPEYHQMVEAALEHSILYPRGC